MYQIETKNPEPAKRNMGKPIYPWHKLNPGQAFFVPNRTIQQICSAAHTCRPKRLWQWRYHCQTGEKDGVRGVWVYRLENDPNKPRSPLWPNTAEEAETRYKQMGVATP